MAVDANTTYYQNPSPPTGYVLSPGKSFWGIVSSEPTINYCANPSFEATLATSSTILTTTNATLSRVTADVFATRGKYGMKITPSSAALSAVIMKDAAIGSEAAQKTFSIDEAGRYTWSFDFKGSPGKAYRLVLVEVDGSPIERNSISFTATGNLERKSISADFQFPSTGASAIHWLMLEQTTAIATPYYTDAWLLEKKDFPTTYVDGDHGGTWQASPHASPTTRAAFKPGGYTYNFKDLGFQIDAYIGAGMPPLANQSVPRGLLKGATYQRTLAGARVLTLTGVIEGDSVAKIQQFKEAMVEIFRPDDANQEGAPLILLFQVLDPVTAAPKGKLLQVPVYYLDGLEGNTDNASQEKIVLRFVSYNPPAVQEIEAEIYESVAYRETITYVAGLANATTFGRSQYGWASDFFEGRAFALGNGRLYGTTVDRVKAFDLLGNPPVLYALGLVSTLTDPGTPTSVTVLALAASSNKLYVAGSTNSGNFVRSAYYNLGSGDVSWSAMLFGLNNTSRAVCVERTSGYIYYGGDFTAAGNLIAGDTTANRVAFWIGTSWNAMITGGNNGVNNTVRALACGLDNTIYVGGDFTSAGGVTTNRIAAWRRDAGTATTGTWAALPSGGTGANDVVRAIAVSPTTGYVFIGGDFTSVNGITANKIAMYNGTNWQPVGGGLNGNVTALWFDKQGILYAAGAFTGTNGTGSYGLPWLVAKYNANNQSSYWLPIDIDIVPTNATINAIAVNEAGQIFVGTSSLGSTGSVGVAYINYSALTTITNEGSADVGPKIVVTGPGELWEITNQTTKKSIYFKDLSLVANETLTIDLASPDNIKLTSNQRPGSMLQYVLPGSDLATWALRPGDNVIVALLSGTSVTSDTAIDLYYFNTHWSFDAGVA